MNDRRRRPGRIAPGPTRAAAGLLVRHAGALAALAVLGGGALAADVGRFGVSDAPADRRLVPALPDGRAEPAARPVLTARRSPLWLFGRDCLPGFALNAGGVCVRHDDPKLACGSPVRPAGCVVLPPDPAPYGLGAALRLDY